MALDTKDPLLTDKTLIRNFAFFFLAVVCCTSGLIYILVAGEYEINKASAEVAHTHAVIAHAEKLSTLVEAMLSAQRGYMVSGQADLLEEYKLKRSTISDHIAALTQLAGDNLAQSSRLDEIRSNFIEFATRLEENGQKFTPSTPVAKITLEDMEEINALKETITKVNNAILREEYSLLKRRIETVEAKKDAYYTTLLIGVIVAAILLLLFNGFLLHAQRKRSHIEASLKDTEERFALAVQGTQDGIFDWDLTTGKIFFSTQFFNMLGYDRGSFFGGQDHLKELLHPEDEVKAWQYIEHYLQGAVSEYSQEFRMKREDGHWAWINARGKAIFDNNNKAIRFVGSHTDITHIKEYQKQLEERRTQAETANRAKSDFLAHMSHEIRTPLTAISGIAEIFEKTRETLNERHQKLVKTLHASTTSLKDLVNDILDFSKIENGELELDITTFKLGQLFEDVISMMSLRANQKGISFVFDYAGIKNMEFIGDKTRLRQILVNLIGNAVKFTQQGGITIKALQQTRDGLSHVRIDIIDTGIGIAPENFDLVFERFKQADASVSRKYGGTGLGLSISRNLAKLMGGDIILSSNVGKGSTFSVILPIRTSDALEQETDNADLNKKLNDKIKNALKGESKILIVEDYDGNVVVISHILEEIGCTYEVAGTGLAALNLWKEKYYDIILMDVQMPEMDGFTATQEIRRLEKENNQPPTPIIGMTAHALLGDKDKCIAAGMNYYLPKPIVETDLKMQILKYLNARRRAA